MPTVHSTCHGGGKLGSAFGLLWAGMACASLALPGLAHAQLSSMPAALQERLRQVGPGWGRDIIGNIARTLEVYAPLLAAAPKDEV